MMSQVIPDEKFATEDHVDDDLEQEYKRSQQKEKEDAELATKTAYKFSLFNSHPDIVRLTKTIRQDPNNPDQQKEVLFHSDDLEDEDIQSDDEELFYVPDRSKWLERCLKEWDVEDGALRTKVRDTKHRFEIFTAGFCSEDGSSGCGAIIRDNSQRPIVAKSKVISDGKDGNYVSQFCSDLEGVALGLELAKKYNISKFYLYCQSENVELFIQQVEAGKTSCFCSGERKRVDTPCEVCMKQSMICDHKDHDRASEIVAAIFSDVSELKKIGLPLFVVYYGVSGFGGGCEKKSAAYFLAKLLKNEELKLKDIGAFDGLWDAIYEEVFGQFVKLKE